MAEYVACDEPRIRNRIFRQTRYLVRPADRSSKWNEFCVSEGCVQPNGEYHDAPMHNRFDQYTKNLLRETLRNASKVQESEVEVIAATQKIDVYAVPDLERVAERKALGLLGELFHEASMFELFSTTPNLGRFRLCLKKQLSWHTELERRARVAATEQQKDLEGAAENGKEIVPYPRLVVVSTGRPDTVLEKFGARNVCPGVYDLVEGLCVYVVVLSELPRTRETLFLRLMGRDRVLAEALVDVKNLPLDAPERCIAYPLLVLFQFEVTDPTPDEKPMSDEIRAWYEGLVEEQKRRVRQAHDDGVRKTVIRQLRVRFGPLPAGVLERIEAADVTTVERWSERLLTAQHLSDVFDEPN